MNKPLYQDSTCAPGRRTQLGRRREAPLVDVDGLTYSEDQVLGD
ncbi:MAG TPA: hypothetical protein VLI93_12800 [Acetobacteraceae bacterium]|nr:hypothetical protein [Acetobacteraceae bacterium]